MPRRRSAAVTIAYIQVDEALKDGVDEYQSITDARAELVELLAEVQQAHTRLHLTQARVEQNVQKLTELKADAAEFSRLKELSAELPATHPEGAQGLAELDGYAVNSQRNGASVPAPFQSVPSYTPRRAKGLQSSLDLEPGLKNFWCAYSPRLSVVLAVAAF